MKIFSYIGSPQGRESNTYKLTKQILDKLIEITSSEVEYEILTPRELQLKHCCGCKNCFSKGSCHLDKVDSFDKIKDKLINADMIIFGSPVYAGTVTSDMKLFIDRLSYWLHLLTLVGKPGISIVTASGNSYRETSSYLKRIMQILGMEVVGNIICTIDAPRMIDDPHFINESIPAYAELLNQYIEGHKEVKSTEFHEKYFQYLKNAYSIPYDIDHAELNYWKKSGYLNFDNYEQLLEFIRSQRVK